jgi:hypothetical protein
MLRRCNLDKVHWSRSCYNRRKERQHEAPSDERRDGRSNCCHDRTDAGPQTSNKYWPATAVPVRDPAEQRSDHLADLKYSEDDPGAAVAFWWEIEVCRVAWYSVDGSHERPIVTLQRSVGAADIRSSA